MSKKHGTKSVKVEAMKLESEGKKQKLGTPTEKAPMDPKSGKGMKNIFGKGKIDHAKKSPKKH